MTTSLILGRRAFIGSGVALAAATGLQPAWAKSVSAGVAAKAHGTLSGEQIRMTIAEAGFPVDDRVGHAVAINGTIPAPLLRLKEGQNVRITVENGLKNEDTSIHWHGFIVPFRMDGVPGISFPGIPPAPASPTSSRSSSRAPTGITATAASRSSWATTARSSSIRPAPIPSPTSANM